MWLTVLCVADGSGTYFMEVDRVSILHKAIKLGQKQAKKNVGAKPRQTTAAASSSSCQRMQPVQGACDWCGVGTALARTALLCCWRSLGEQRKQRKD